MTLIIPSLESATTPLGPYVSVHYSISVHYHANVHFYVQQILMILQYYKFLSPHLSPQDFSLEGVFFLVTDIKSVVFIIIL